MLLDFGASVSSITPANFEGTLAPQPSDAAGGRFDNLVFLNFRSPGDPLGSKALAAASLHASHGLITSTPAASKGPVSRVATAKRLAAAIAAM